MAMENPYLQAADDNNPALQEYLRRKRMHQPTLPPEEAKTLLGSVADAGLGALHYVGGVLDKTFGGRAVRGALGGNANELLSVLPGSDLVGLTDQKNSVSGNDLLEQWGALSKKDPEAGFEWRDLAGPGLELALDPSTYLTLGTGSALTEAGKAAQLTGDLAKTAAGRIRAGQSGLAGFGLPFAHPSAVVGTGEAGARVAEGLGAAGDRLLYSPPGRIASRLFDPQVQGMTGELAQRALRGRKGLAEAGQAGARGDFLNVGKYLEDNGVSLADLSGPRRAEFRQVLEGLHPNPDPILRQAADMMHGRTAQALAEGQGVGRNVSELSDDVAKFATRQMTQPAAATPGFARNATRRPFNPASANQTAREDILRNLPGGTEGANAMVADPALRQILDGSTPEHAAEYIRRNHLGVSRADEIRLRGTGDDAEAIAHGYVDAADSQAKSLQNNVPPERVSQPNLTTGAPTSYPNPAFADYSKLLGQHQQASGLAGYLKDLDPAFHQAGGIFMNNPVTDYATYLQRHAVAQEGAGAIHDLLASGANVGGEGIDALDALRRAGLGADMATNVGAQAGAVDTLLGRLNARGMNLADLRNVKINPEAVDDAGRLVRGLSVGNDLEPVLGAWDSLTNITKSFQTGVFPSFHSRNMLTGLWQNFVTGAFHPGEGGALNPYNYVRPYMDAVAARGNKTIVGAADIFKGVHPGITDEAATRLLMEEMYQNAARTGVNTREAIGLGALGDQVPIRLPGTGGERAAGDVLNPAKTIEMLRAEGNSVADMANPLNVRGSGFGTNAAGDGAGVLGPLRQESGNALVRYGQGVGELGDDLNRVSSFIAFRRQGYGAEQAAMKAKAAHYDYSKLTDFEREAMRRVMPFYNWTRQNIPFQLQQLLEHPGGVTASAVKGADDVRAQTGFVPENVASGLAIPLGAEGEDGRQRFLTNTGLPFEDAFGMIGTGGKPVQRTMEKVLGMTNPLIKGPLEYLAGRQFFSGRNLDDLYSVSGNNAAEQAIMNSPLSRFWTMGRQLGDDRKDLGTKALALLGPAKATDIDMEKQRGIAAKEVATKMLEGNSGVRTFSNLYVKPEDLAKLSPEQLQLYSLYQYLEQQRQKAARKEPK